MRLALPTALLALACGSDRLTAVSEVTTTTLANGAPVAVIDVTSNAVAAGTMVSFDGARSTDDVAVVRHTWNFGDGTTANGPQATHLFPVSGAFAVTLVVADGGGLEGRAATSIRVAPPAAATLPSPSVWSWDLVDGSRRGECGGFQSSALTIVTVGTVATLKESGGPSYDGTYDPATRRFEATHSANDFTGLVETIRATFDESFQHFEGDYVVRASFVCSSGVARAVHGTRISPAP
jgi:hypothetical protein